MIVKSKWAALAGLCASTGVFAEHHGTEETRNHQAHVHGEVSFNIAQDGEDLIIAISAPGADIVGFEHAPENAQEEEILKLALASLGAPEHLFVFNKDAQCQLSEHLIEQSLSSYHDDHEEDHDDEHEDEHDDEHDEDHDDEHEDEHDDKHDEDHDDEHEDEHDDKHDEDHDDEHEDEHHDEHDEDHDDEHEDEHDDKHDEDHDDDHEGEHEEESHAAFEIAYQYQCHDVAELSEIKTNWFKYFPNTEEIHVNLLTDQSQKVLELDATNSDINF